MKLVSDMSAAEYGKFKDDLWSASSPPMPATVLPNGSRFDYDRRLGVTVETLPDGSSYVVRLGDRGLVRSDRLIFADRDRTNPFLATLEYHPGDAGQSNNRAFTAGLIGLSLGRSAAAAAMLYALSRQLTFSILLLGLLMSMEILTLWIALDRKPRRPVERP